MDCLLQRADTAMYVAKDTNVGYAFYDASVDTHASTRLALIGELRRAIEDGELVLHYQPKVSVRTGRIAGVEALIRWHHPERGLVMPDDFIPVAQETSLIKPHCRCMWSTRPASSGEPGRTRGAASRSPSTSPC